MSPGRARLAFILCAGVGKRLGPLTARMPKALLPLKDRPMVFHVLDALRAAGVRRFLVNLHAHPRVLRPALEKYGRRHRVTFEFLRERILLDTGGALDNARRFLTEPFWLVNCDFFPGGFSFPRMEAFHRRSASIATLAVRPMRRGEPFNPVGVDRRGRVVRVTGVFGRGGRDHVFLGVHRLDPAVMEHLDRKKKKFPIFPGLYRNLEREGHPIGAFPSPSCLDLDLGTLEGYFNANLTL